jgi:phospholipid/cholesterol/gamma-HCH transport system ATP-binding protein
MSDEVGLLEFDRVSLSFDGLPALVDVSFTLRRGQTIFVTGASGAGKSVLLRLALGLLRPDAGHIYLQGSTLDALSEDELLGLRGRLVGMVFQEQAAFTGLSVYDNTAFNLVEHGWAEAEVDKAVWEMLRFVGLQDDAEKLPEELSGGMERRLEVARSLIGWPPVMLYDEPASGLDPINSEQVLRLIARAREQHGVSALFVTKDMSEIEVLSQNGGGPEASVLVLDAGRVIFHGPPKDFFASDLPAVTRLTQADNGTRLSDFYTPDPWSKKRKPRE